MDTWVMAQLARSASRSAGFIAMRERPLAHHDLTAGEIADINELIAYHEAVIADVKRLVPNEALISAWRSQRWVLGERDGKALVDEIERRGIRLPQ